MGLRSFLYSLARSVVDVNAVKKGMVGKQVVRRQPIKLLVGHYGIM